LPHYIYSEAATNMTLFCTDECCVKFYDDFFWLLKKRIIDLFYVLTFAASVL